MFTKRQEAEIITAIKGRGEVPLKYNYMTKRGANAWDRIAKVRQDSKVKGINSIEGTLLSSKADAFLAPYKEFKKINIIDDMEATIDKAVKYGGKIIWPIKSGITVKRIAFISDPNGVPIELVELNP